MRGRRQRASTAARSCTSRARLRPRWTSRTRSSKAGGLRDPVARDRGCLANVRGAPRRCHDSGGSGCRSRRLLTSWWVRRGGRAVDRPGGGTGAWITALAMGFALRPPLVPRRLQPAPWGAADAVWASRTMRGVGRQQTDTIQIREFDLPNWADRAHRGFPHCDPLRRLLGGRRIAVLWPSATPGSGPANPSKNGCNWVGTTGTDIAAFEGTPFILGQSAPDPGALAGLHGPTQTGLNNLAPTADGLGFLYLDKRGAGVPDREEQLGVHS